MKKIKYFVLAMAAMFLFSSTDYVYASEVESLKAVQAVAEVGARTVKTLGSEHQKLPIRLACRQCMMIRH